MTDRTPLGLDPDLLALLRCPKEHHSVLLIDETAGLLVCSTCGDGYPVVDGLPVMLQSDVVPNAGGDR